jgi:hypothetical protein
LVTWADAAETTPIPANERSATNVPFTRIMVKFPFPPGAARVQRRCRSIARQDRRARPLRVCPVADHDVRPIDKLSCGGTLVGRSEPIRACAIGYSRASIFILTADCRFCEIHVAAHTAVSHSDREAILLLYPSEVLSLLGCEDIPIARRVLYAYAVR